MRRVLLLILFIIFSGIDVYAQQSGSEDSDTYEPETTNDSPYYDSKLPPTAIDEDYDDSEENEEYDEEIIYHPVPLPMKKEERNIDENTWQKLISDKAFDYVPKKKKEVSDRVPTGTSWLDKFFISLFEFFTSVAGKIVIWSVVIALVLFIIFRVVKLNGNVFFNKKDKKNAANSDELSDEYIPDDWEAVIQKAIQSGNLRLAVRHAYRYVLILLSEKELIKYQSAKTNYQYAAELAGSQWYQPFMQMTRQYEYAWYGGFDLKQQQFDHYYNLLRDFKNRLDY